MSGIVEQIVVLARIRFEIEQLAPAQLAVGIEGRAAPFGDHGVAVDATVDMPRAKSIQAIRRPPPHASSSAMIRSVERTRQ